MKTRVLTITSAAFSSMGEIPRKYTCEGINISPPLSIGNLPDESRSLVLIVDDPDAPGGTWTHWVMWNIHPVHEIKEGEAPGIQGQNDFGVDVYGGPCPPSGSHHYHFKIYALNRMLDLPEGSNKKEVERVMEKYILAYGELIGRYKKTIHHSFA